MDHHLPVVGMTKERQRLSLAFASGDPLLLLGPQGSGKTTICERLVATHPGIERVVTCTTRPPRTGERDGVDYHFRTEAEFDKGVAEGEFLEWAHVHAHRYGTPQSSIIHKLSLNTDLVMNIDVQGVQSLRVAVERNSALRGRLTTVFILPPNFDVIRRRILNRGKETPEQIERRLKIAQHEIEQWVHYDYCLLTGTKDEDYTKVESIWRAEKLRVSRLRTV